MIKDGNYVVVHYTGTFEDGTVFDSSSDRQPLEFKVGEGSVIPGFESAIVQMNIEEEKNIVIQPDDAYGRYDDSLIHSFPAESVREQFDPEVGMTIGVQLENGNQIPALITEVGEESVTIDLNHPLAGKTLHFNVKLLEVNDAPKYNTGCESGCCDTGCCDTGCCDPGCSC